MSLSADADCGQDRFFSLADFATSGVRGNEVLLLRLRGENSDFVRFNQGRVRQAGTVAQRALSLELLEGSRHAAAELSLTGDLQRDRAAIGHEIDRLREVVVQLPPDPHLLYATDVGSSERVEQSALPTQQQALQCILSAAAKHDFVGIYASGRMCRGFANSLGQRNWHASDSVHLDWSLHGPGGIAVKDNYATRDWQAEVLELRLEESAKQLDMLRRPAKRLQPGVYRVYLAPSAMFEIVALLSWGGFGLKSQRTKQTPLLRLTEGALSLSPELSIDERGDGTAAGFDDFGFPKPGRLNLIRGGRIGDALVSARSAAEFSVAPNGAGPQESPESLEIQPGSLPGTRVLQELGQGIFISNLWYLNYSDKASCRLTGMTRFACLWVERGQFVAAIEPLRFDDSIYRIWGDRLVGLTDGSTLVFDAESYGGRSTTTASLPGALISEMRFTL